jgi:hypothetical protein
MICCDNRFANWLQNVPGVLGQLSAGSKQLTPLIGSTTFWYHRQIGWKS